MIGSIGLHYSESDGKLGETADSESFANGTDVRFSRFASAGA